MAFDINDWSMAATDDAAAAAVAESMKDLATVESVEDAAMAAADAAKAAQEAGNAALDAKSVADATARTVRADGGTVSIYGDGTEPLATLSGEKVSFNVGGIEVASFGANGMRTPEGKIAAFGRLAMVPHTTDDHVSLKWVTLDG